MADPLIDLLQEDRQAIPRGMPYDRAWAEWLEYIGAAKDRYEGPAKPRTGSRTRLVAAGDFHVPYHSKQALAKLLIEEAPKTDVLLIGGDFGDGQSVSQFTKYDLVPYEVEHAEKTLILEQLSQAFPSVLFLEESNHADRVEKRLRENVSRDVLSAVMTMTGGTLNPDIALCSRFPNVKIANWTTPSGIKLGWLALVGDVLFCHAEQYSKVPAAVLRSLQERIDDNRKHWGLPPVRCLVQFHTHAMAWVPWRSDMLLVEPGCMAEVMGYQTRAKGGGRPQRVGYVSMELEDGKVDVNSVRLHWVDAA